MNEKPRSDLRVLIIGAFLLLAALVWVASIVYG